MRDLPTGTVTFLFTDIEASTRLQYELGVERYAGLRVEHNRRLREACERHGGVEVDAAGDGLFVAFSTGSGAVAAAVDAQLTLLDLVAVRMGLHSGEPLLTADGYAGVDVANAARIAAVAHGGQILVSQTTADLVGHELRDVGLRDLGEHSLKDVRPQRLHQVVADGLPYEFPPLRSLDSRSTNIPLNRPELIGRIEELREIAELLRGDRRLITLTGPGGTGKTALALEAAAGALDEFRDGVFLVRLETVTDPALVMSAIADALPVRKVLGMPPVQVAEDFLRDRQVLVVLDNFEYVLASAPSVSALLDRAPDARFLVTSIAPLRVTGEVELPVRPLALPRGDITLEGLAATPAVALFARRARSVRSDFVLNKDNAGSIAQVCVALDGLPLALELAAARTRVLSPAALLERVERPLALLEGGARDAPDRHRTLRATIDWSFALLEQSLQQLFARLSVFSGGAALEAVDTVCRPADDLGLDLVDGLARLVECSMLKTEERDDQLRFVLLETLREYAREQLDASGEADELQQRHATFYLGDPELVASFTGAGESGTLVPHLERELDNVRAALDWAQKAGSALELGLATLYQLSPRVFPAEGREVLKRALGRDDRADPRLRARALAAAGGLARTQGDVEDAERCLLESIELYREIGDARGEIVVLFRLGTIAADRDDLEAALRLAIEHEAAARRLGDAQLIAVALCVRADLDMASGAYDEARARLDECATLVGEDDSWVMLERSALEIVDGTPARAVSHAARALVVVRERNNERQAWWAIDGLAAALAHAGELAVAVRLYAPIEQRSAERGASLRYGPGALYERIYGPLLDGMSSPELEAARAEGRAMTVDEAAAFGLNAAGHFAERA